MRREELFQAIGQIDDTLIVKSGKQICLIFCVTMTIFLCSCGENIPEYIATSATVEAGDVFSASDFLLK